MAALHKGLLGEEGVEGGINLVGHILEEDRAANADAVLDALDVVLTARLDHLHRLAAVRLADPPVGLHLRINHQRPAARVGEDQRILNG